MFDTMQRSELADEPETYAEFDRIDRLAEVIQLTQQDAPWSQGDQDQLPSEFEVAPPGVPLAAMLDQVDHKNMSGWGQIALLRAHQRMVSHHQARLYQTMAAIAATLGDEYDDPQSAIDGAAAEVRVALRLTRRAADSELDLALDLTQRLPQLIDALALGTIDIRRARAIVHGTAHLPDDTARTVAEAVMGDAPRLTTGQLVARLRKLCIDADPDQATTRYREAVAQRRVSSQATESGTANLYGIDLPPHRLAAALSRINHTAKALKSRGDVRTMDQLRADVLLDLLEGASVDGQGGTGGGRSGVNIHVDLLTLTGLADHPGELAGFGPVIADIARQVTEHQTRSQWRYTVTDPETGMFIDAGTTRRRPTARQRRFVEARDRVCVFPGCRMPAVECDLDHIEPHGYGGITSTSNLAPACRHDHNTHTKLGWTYRRLEGGDYQWTTKLGWTCTTSGRPP